MVLNVFVDDQATQAYGIYLIISFLSSWFSSQTRTDLVLVKFYYNAAVRRFLKTFRKLQENDCDGDQF